jgi:hypothetical protein
MDTSGGNIKYVQISLGSPDHASNAALSVPVRGPFPAHIRTSIDFCVAPEVDGE